MEENLTADKKIEKARVNLILNQPFFGTILLYLNARAAVPVENCKTLMTNGVDLLYNNDFIDGLSLTETIGCLAHEVMHIACKHHLRRNNRDIGEWNQAADYVINPILKNSGFKLPTGIHIEPKFADYSTEQVFRDLFGNKHKKKKSNGKPDPNGQGKPDPNGPPDPNAKPDPNGQGKPDPNGQDPGQGQNTKGTPDPQAAPNNDPNGHGEVRDLPPNTPGGHNGPADLNNAEQHIDRIVRQAANLQKSFNSGKSIGNALDRFVTDLFKPKIDWKTMLQDFVEQSAKNDYSWDCVDRRFAAHGLILPDLQSNEVGTVVIGIDTSCSLSKNELKEFATEISSILEQFNAITITVMYCDTKINGEPEEYHSDDLPITLSFKGGGGTDFKPIFEKIDHESIDVPTCLIYFTDMECSSYPKNYPDYPVLWLNTQNRLAYGPPPFGDVVYMNKE